MADPKMTPIDLEPVGSGARHRRGGRLDDRPRRPSRRTGGGRDRRTGPYGIAVALAMRLLNDPDFHDDVMEWYESQEDDEDEDEEDRRGR